MKKLQVLETERAHNWTLYRLSRTPNPLLEQNLKCLQDLRNEDVLFKRDLKRKEKVIQNWTQEHADCPPILSDAIQNKHCECS